MARRRLERVFDAARNLVSSTSTPDRNERGMLLDSLVML
jgi:hypothetical protein